MEIFVPKQELTSFSSIPSLGLQHLAFVISDLDGMISTLDSYNPGEVIVGHSGMRTCIITSPDGVIIELKERRII